MLFMVLEIYFDGKAFLGGYVTQYKNGRVNKGLFYQLPI